MGQKSSRINSKLSRAELSSLTWILRSTTKSHHHNPHPEQPIKFQFKTKRKKLNGEQENNLSENNEPLNNNTKNINNNVCVVGRRREEKKTNLEIETRGKNKGEQHLIAAQGRTKSVPNLILEDVKCRGKRKSGRAKAAEEARRELGFGYEIADIDGFLMNATIEKPANIPVVLAFPTVLYQTRLGGHQAEIYLPLGMVVNAVFKNQHWLYVQTPHAEEGYVSYAACIPLGIIPPPEESSPPPCWENNTDIFPKPSGNLTDSEKLSSKSGCSGRRCRSSRARLVAPSTTCSEKSVDKLYLKAARRRGTGTTTRQTLMVVCCDYESESSRALRVKKGDVVTLVGSGQVNGWFFVKKGRGGEGFVPEGVVGNGFL